MQVITLIKSKTLIKTAGFVLLLSIAVFAPLLKQQFITGPIVNAVLFVSTAYLGVLSGILIGFLPSLFAYFAGLLPVPLLPMIPYIIMSNAILVICFGILKKRNFFGAAVIASFLKFLFLFSSSSYIISFFIKKSLPAPIIAMMAWPQLITALLGSIIAFIILKSIKHV